MGTEQQSLTEFRAGKTTEDITRTIRLKLEASQWKHNHVREAIDDWQHVARRTAELLPSFERYQWQPRNTSLRRTVVDEISDYDLSIYAKERTDAINKVAEAFSSWLSNGADGEYPTGQFGDGDYFRMSTSSSSKDRREIVENEQGFGLYANILKPADWMWFHIDVGEYQREWLEKVVDGEADLGVVEFRYDENSQLWAHVSVSEPVEVYEPRDLETTLGVDLGERILWAAAVVGPDGVETVEMEPGQQFRHYREQLDRKREAAMEDNQKQKLSSHRHRYTEQVTHTATRRIVDLAADHAPCKIRFEDLTGYRESAVDPIHDWPHDMLTTQLAYKATEAGIPAEAINPSQTSITCRQCDATNPQFRDGDNFECWECGYEVHADVNAAINIATWGE
jgi:IS605 OrfB family transposase